MSCVLCALHLARSLIRVCTCCDLALLLSCRERATEYTQSPYQDDPYQDMLTQIVLRIPFGHENSNPIKLRYCLSKTLWNPESLVRRLAAVLAPAALLLLAPLSEAARTSVRPPRLVRAAFLCGSDVPMCRKQRKQYRENRQLPTPGRRPGAAHRKDGGRGDGILVLASVLVFACAVLLICLFGCCVVYCSLLLTCVILCVYSYLCSY